MAKKKVPTTTKVAAQSETKGNNQVRIRVIKDDPLPILKYFSLAVSQSLLLLFSITILPRTTLTFKDLPPQTSSRDRPQSEFMAPITAWPALSVGWMCIGAAFVQIYWGSKAAAWIEYDILKETGAHKDDAKLREGDQSTRHLLKACAATLVGALLCHALIITLGAPFYAYVLHTFALALHISILTVYVPARCLTLPSFWSPQTDETTLKQKWKRIFNQLSPKSGAERALLYPALGTIFGAWCGAYPLALDWDRPWQAWPLTPAVGATLGYILGQFASLFVSSVIHLARSVEVPPSKKE